MSQPEYTRAALNDLAELIQYAARDKPQAALKLVEKIETKCRLVARSPEIGAVQSNFGEGVRATLVGRYVIYYRMIGDRVEILRVIAGDQDTSVL